MTQVHNAIGGNADAASTAPNVMFLGASDAWGIDGQHFRAWLKPGDGWKYFRWDGKQWRRLSKRPTSAPTWVGIDSAALGAIESKDG